jgi:hypothetical protein
VTLTLSLFLSLLLSLSRAFSGWQLLLIDAPCTQCLRHGDPMLITGSSRLLGPELGPPMELPSACPPRNPHAERRRSLQSVAAPWQTWCAAAATESSSSRCANTCAVCQSPTLGGTRHQRDGGQKLAIAACAHLQVRLVDQLVLCAMASELGDELCTILSPLPPDDLCQRSLPLRLQCLRPQRGVQLLLQTRAKRGELRPASSSKNSRRSAAELSPERKARS